MGFVGWLFRNAQSVEIAHKNMAKEAEVKVVYSAAEFAIFKGRQPTRNEKNASWSHVMLLKDVMVELKTASTADRAALLVVLKMLEVKGLHVQTEGHRCGCKEYVVKMIEDLSADGRVVAEFAAQRRESRVWREMQARREERPERPEEEPERPKSRLRRPMQPEPMPKRAKTQPKAPKAAPKNKSLYTKHLKGLAVTSPKWGLAESRPCIRGGQKAGSSTWP